MLLSLLLDQKVAHFRLQTSSKMLPSTFINSMFSYLKGSKFVHQWALAVMEKNPNALPDEAACSFDLAPQHLYNWALQQGFWYFHLTADSFTY